MERIKENKLNPAGYFVNALRFEIQMTDACRRKNDRWSMTLPEKISLLAQSLKPAKAKELIRNYSSFNWGRHILTLTFPKAENPEEYHSRNGVVCINESPVQMLGWDDLKRLTEEGIEKGLDKDYIDRGFEIEAERRGIDLEWSFFDTPPPRKVDSNILTG
ncbi:MAG: hypothetical protein US75_C0012G0033 [Candidatus Woesebacteria bacterium GW2011_GWC1_38_13]|uniref:Uncharacterized protein n=2 Tax=Candidatus Woeseibacteriota TaxID=1752722 RepID=A0A0G0KZV6_9BACT|nr:MAG: hypothetical protein US75_C0012G0033 [Candidatus Woesebacteria bacterium GW2011_GWC1_38_13]KKQ84282.1 MAG: hypothetical protein UT06_C0006G0017 [Candidatus Woesebacteria bacterium GW2011_GWA1_38_8]